MDSLKLIAISCISSRSTSTTVLACWVWG